MHEQLPVPRLAEQSSPHSQAATNRTMLGKPSSQDDLAHYTPETPHHSSTALTSGREAQSSILNQPVTQHHPARTRSLKTRIHRKPSTQRNLAIAAQETQLPPRRIVEGLILFDLVRVKD